MSRSELRPILNVLFLPAGSWAERLRRARLLAEGLPESWASRRSGQSRPQFARVRAALREIFQAPPPEEELRFLLGWLSREIKVREEEEKDLKRHQR